MTKKIATSKMEGGVVPCDAIETRDWYAWNNLMPPPPNRFFITGEVLVPNPGVVPVLCFKVPQGINPSILLLDLWTIQLPGVWPQVLVWKTVRYERIIGGFPYQRVNVFCGDEIIVDAPVIDVH